MDLQARLDRLLPRTMAQCPVPAENGIGPSAPHSHRSKVLLSLCYTVVAILLLLLLVAENVGKILLFMNNKSVNTTVEVFLSDLSNVSNQAMPVALAVHD